MKITQDKNLVYLITNLANSKIYVGKTVGTLKQRWYLHLYDIQRGSTFALHKAIRKYGKDKFSIEPITVVPSTVDINNLEKLWIILLCSYDSRIGYNCTYGGQDGVQTPEVRKRMGAISKARWASGWKPLRTGNPEIQKAIWRLKSSLEKKQWATRMSIAAHSDEVELRRIASLRKNTEVRHKLRTYIRIRICYNCFKPFSTNKRTIPDKACCSPSCFSSIYNKLKISGIGSKV